MLLIKLIVIFCKTQHLTDDTKSGYLSSMSPDKCQSQWKIFSVQTPHGNEILCKCQWHRCGFEFDLGAVFPIFMTPRILVAVTMTLYKLCAVWSLNVPCVRICKANACM